MLFVATLIPPRIYATSKEGAMHSNDYTHKKFFFFKNTCGDLPVLTPKIPNKMGQENQYLKKFPLLRSLRDLYLMNEPLTNPIFRVVEVPT